MVVWSLYNVIINPQLLSNGEKPKYSSKEIILALSTPLLFNIIGYIYTLEWIISPKYSSTNINKQKNQKILEETENEISPEYQEEIKEWKENNEFLLKLIELQKRYPNNFSKKTLSLWVDFMKNKVRKELEINNNEDYYDKFINGKKYFDSETKGEFEMFFSVLFENGSFLKDGKKLYEGYNVKIEISIGDDFDDYLAILNFFPAPSNSFSSKCLVANLPFYDEFVFDSSVSADNHSFNEFCELLSSLRVIDYNNLEKDKKERIYGL